MKTFKQAMRPTGALAVVTAAALLFGCGSGGGGTSALKDAPADVAAVYKARCLNCHGSELQGRVGPGTNLQQVGGRMNAADIAAQIREGSSEGVMPAFEGTLTAEEIDGLANWLAGKQ